MKHLGWLWLFIVALILTGTGGDGAAEQTEAPPVVLGPGSVVVTAGSPGSLEVVERPARAGPGIRCTWHELVVGPDGSATSRSSPPVPGRGAVLWCLHPDDTVVAGYPILVVYDPRDPLPGVAVSSEEAARFALERIDFEPPAVLLSPPGGQVVGVATWLAVTSRLAYDEVTAQAGPVWASVRPVFRDVVWRLGDGGTVVCTDDATTTWTAAPADAAKESECTHGYERSSGDGAYQATATVSWTILWRNDRDPGAWRVFDTLALTTPVAIEVTSLQAAIR